MRTFYYACIILFLFQTPAFADEPEVFQITATVTGGEADTGVIRGALYASKSTYMSDSVSSDSATVGPDGSVVLDFGQHPAGTYAITVYYDINDNKKLDTGFLRIPKEKIGYSNNARGRFGPAKWKDTRFDITEAIELTIVIANAKKK